MTPPLTRRDLEEVLDQRLANHPTHAQLEQVLDQRLANHPTHAQLEEIFDRRLADHPTHAQLADQLAQLRTEIASDTRTTMTVLLEDAFKRFRVIDDQYKDLPDRVHKLEEAVFSPPRARRKRSS
ncbi:MAG: hypothetical protein ABJE66_03830 [Deltaproteobacteria bacterium]